jgi:hypothetical protein
MPKTRLALDDEPWRDLPNSVADLIEGEIEPISAEILESIAREVPEYARRLEGRFGRGIRRGVGEALAQFVALIRDPDAGRDSGREVYLALGRGEQRAGRTLDSLQAAYRIGARVAWRRFADACRRAGLGAEPLSLLAEAVFAYIDELSLLSIEGYSAAQARETGALERRRRHLLELILAQPPTPPAVLAEAAGAARCDLPDSVVVIALDPRRERQGLAAPAFDNGILMDLEGDEPCLLVSNGHEDQIPRISTELTGWQAAVGPRASLGRAANSLRIARRIIALARRGILPDEPVIHATEHLSTLWLLNDEFLLDELVAHRLAPLIGMTSKQRARLSDTLLAWLQTQGNVLATASVLDVHPQTVRYRMHQLEDRFGDDLDDPDLRFDMEIALRALRLPGSSAAALRHKAKPTGEHGP